MECSRIEKTVAVRLTVPELHALHIAAIRRRRATGLNGMPRRIEKTVAVRLTVPELHALHALAGGVVPPDAAAQQWQHFKAAMVYLRALCERHPMPPPSAA